MHFHLPKPLHGWREFAGEVGIIVLGVGIALSAEQIVEAGPQVERERTDSELHAACLRIRSASNHLSILTALRGWIGRAKRQMTAW